MRILAFTDIHGAYRKVEEILSTESSFDVVVIGGDLTTYGTPAEATEAIKGFQRFGRPVLVVAGNMDPPELDGTFDKLGVSINARGVVLGNAGFFGVSAAPFSPLHTPYEISEDDILVRAEEGWKGVESARWKVFVPHAPPINTKLDRIPPGKHVGSTAVRAFIEKHHPHVTVCGHIHEARGTDSIGKTLIINCGPAGQGYYGVIELGEHLSVENRGL